MKNDLAYRLQSSLSHIEPYINTRWEHYKGGIYRVVMKAVESNEPHRVKVIYEKESDGSIWEHPLDEWEKEVELDNGNLVKRFSPYYGDVFEIVKIIENHWD